MKNKGLVAGLVGTAVLAVTVYVLFYAGGRGLSRGKAGEKLV